MGLVNCQILDILLIVLTHFLIVLPAKGVVSRGSVDLTTSVYSLSCRR